MKDINALCVQNAEFQYTYVKERGMCIDHWCLRCVTTARVSLTQIFYAHL
jgi:hypothetical protein